jgi:hypothetical protein
LKYFAVFIVSTVLVVFYLIRFQGMRMELDGSGIWPMVSFYNPERHMEEIARNRAPEPPPSAAPATTVPAEAATVATLPDPVAVKMPEFPLPFWTDFRGPRRDGHYDEQPILTHWPANGLSRLWRKPIGGGYASFVVANGKAFTIEQRRNQEVVAAYDLSTGGELWSNAWDALFTEALGGDGPRATPTWHDGRMYALGAEGELRCLDAATGRRIWSKNILA